MPLLRALAECSVLKAGPWSRFHSTTTASIWTRRRILAKVNSRLRGTIPGVVQSAVSPNGRYFYAASPTGNGVGVYDTTRDAWTTFFDGFELPVGYLEGVNSIVTSSANGIQYALVVSPVNGIATVLQTDANGLTTVHGTFSSSALVGIASLAYSTDNDALYAMTSSQLARIAISSDLLTIGAKTSISGTDMTGIRLGNGKLYNIHDGGASIRELALDLSSVLSAIEWTEQRQ